MNGVQYNNSNHLTVETRAILACKQISYNSFKKEITYDLLSYKSCMYIHLYVCKQRIDVKQYLLHSNTWNHLNVCNEITNSKYLLYGIDTNTWNHSIVYKNELRLVLKCYRQNVFISHI